MLTLVTVLQQDCGIRYNPDLISEPSLDNLQTDFTTDSRNLFLHGLVTGKKMGTCASMPVLYLVMARLLNYPVKLVGTKTHLFLRWDDDREKINLEATGRGLAVFPDEYFQKGILPISDEEIAQGFFLNSMSPEQELTVFMSNRAGILSAQKKYRESFDVYSRMLELVPNHPFSLNNQKVLVRDAIKAGVAAIIPTVDGNIIAWANTPGDLPRAVAAWHARANMNEVIRMSQPPPQDGNIPPIPNPYQTSNFAVPQAPVVPTAGNSNPSRNPVNRHNNFNTGVTP